MRIGIDMLGNQLGLLDRHLAGVVTSALAERFGHVHAALAYLSCGVEAARTTYLQNVAESSRTLAEAV